MRRDLLMSLPPCTCIRAELLRHRIPRRLPRQPPLLLFRIPWERYVLRACAHFSGLIRLTYPVFFPLVFQIPNVSSEAAPDDQHELHNDESSFSLFNQSFNHSFDTAMSESFGMEDALLSPQQQQNQSHTTTLHHHHVTGISFSGMKMGEDVNSSSETSVGNISPIKLVYSSNAARLHPSSAAMNKKRFPPSSYPRDSAMGAPPIIAHGWKSDDVQHCHRSNPFFVLRSSRKAFENTKYLLPCLRPMNTSCPVNMSEHHGSIRQYKQKELHNNYTNSEDLVIATRRVEAAICAFGGAVSGTNSRRQQTWSIFRTKGAPMEARRVYEQCLPRRYVMSGSHISWDVEENPPIHVDPQMDEQRSKVRKTQSPKKEDSGPILTANSSSSTGGDSHSDSAKMKYKCKKCGQLKQNHNCPYQEKLQRSIGCMVYPAVNSYTAAEPGVIAPAFTKMNNFVSYDSDHNSPQPEYASRDTTAPRPPLDAHPYTGHPSTISPESLRGATFFHSPQSSLSTGSSEDPMTTGTPYMAAGSVRGVSAQSTTTATTGTTAVGCKRPHEQVIGPVSSENHSRSRHAPFVAEVNLRPEHYRAVTPQVNKSESKEGGGPTTTSMAYRYPAIALSFSERKRLSDTLFFLSKEIPSITTDCAAALREARRSNEWDLAVAELLAQVVVGLFCCEGDVRLEGLQRYLLTLGISC